MIIRPTHINFYASMDDLLINAVRRLCIEDAESMIAHHRTIQGFTWMESIPSPFVDIKHESQVINPDKLALCYFGPDVGYAVVACEKILKGELLIFAGEHCPLPNLNPANPYVAVIENHYINAKKTGGFASMLMDVPDEATLQKLTKHVALADLDRITAQNLKPSDLEIDPCVVLIETTEDIEPGCILGLNYPPALRLTYTNFIGFFKSGLRASANINQALNRVIYKEHRYKDLPVHNLEQTIKNIKQGRYLKAFNYIEDSADRKNLLSQLYDDELDSLVKFINNGAAKTGGIHGRVSDLVSKERARRPYENEFIDRKLSTLILESNAKQIAHKGKGRLELFKQNLHQAFIVYPGIAKDYQEIANYWKKSSNLSKAENYFKIKQIVPELIKYEALSIAEEATKISTLSM